MSPACRRSFLSRVPGSDGKRKVSRVRFMMCSLSGKGHHKVTLSARGKTGSSAGAAWVCGDGGQFDHPVPRTVPPMALSTVPSAALSTVPSAALSTVPSTVLPTVPRVARTTADPVVLPVAFRAARQAAPRVAAAVARTTAPPVVRPTALRVAVRTVP